MQTFAKTIVAMDTEISVQAVSSFSANSVEEKINQAFSAFHEVERICSRFDSDSEVMRLLHQINTPVPVSRLLFEAISFACEVAAFTNGIFDPAVGHMMEKHGFNRHYLTGQVVHSELPDSADASYQDIVLNAERQTVLLQKPLILDLGAVAKGLAADLAAKALQEMEGFAIDAGGDVRVGGMNAQGDDWKVGIRHPGEPNQSICKLRLTDAAVCTSGNYERRSKSDPSVHHLIHPHTRKSPEDLISVTVIAPHAMMADALSTAAFLMGCSNGMELLGEADAEGVFITPDYSLHLTKDMRRYLIE